MDDPRERQREILGDGPRLEPLKPDELDEFALTLHKRIREMANRDLIDRTLNNLPEVVGTMFRHPTLFEKHIATGIHLTVHGTLPPRERELAILRVGWLCGAPYEFGEHVHIGRGIGLTADDFAAVKIGSIDPHWTAHERAILSAVEELHSDARISTATWDKLAQCYDDQQLIELPILIGHYKQTAYVQNSLALRLHEGNKGLLAG